jgi:hypothetical protein
VTAKVAEILAPAGLRATSRSWRRSWPSTARPPEYYQLAENYGISIQDDWIEDLERTYGVKP